MILFGKRNEQTCREKSESAFYLHYRNASRIVIFVGRKYTQRRIQCGWKEYTQRVNNGAWCVQSSNFPQFTSFIE